MRTASPVKSTTAPKPDYLALCMVGGGSSYGRAPTKEEAVANCKRSLEVDWKSVYDLDGTTAYIGVYDLTHHGDVWWDHSGHVHPNEGGTVPLLELVAATLTVKKKRRARA